jgi:uncharacterized membrane protein HdeD (DUF308 family)
MAAFAFHALADLAVAIDSDRREIRRSLLENRMESALAKVAQRASGFSLVLSVFLILFGILAIMLPVAMSLGVVVVIAWLLIISGVVQGVHAFRCEGIGSKLWRLLVAIIYVAMGIFLRVNLHIGLAALTLAMILFCVTQGVFTIGAYLLTRNSGASGWLLFDGVITLVLGLMIWRHWPASSFWVLGTFAGINMISSGMSRLGLTLAVRKVLKASAQAA